MHFEVLQKKALCTSGNTGHDKEVGKAAPGGDAKDSVVDTELWPAPHL